MAESLKILLLKILKSKLMIPILIIISLIFLVTKFMEQSMIILSILLALALVIVCYFLYVCFHSIDFNTYEEVKKAESVEEKRMAMEAREKFKIPLIGHILRWMYKEGWFYSIAIITLILISIFLRFHALGDFDFRTDEYAHFSSAIGYLKTGEFVRWNFLVDSPGEEYTRAWPFTWQIAQSFKIFGVSIFSGRLVSFLWGTLFLPLVYLVTKRITDSKKVALLTLFLIALDPYFIFLSRWMRMYQMFIVLFFLMIYFFYIGFEYRHKEKIRGNRLVKWFYRNDTNPLYLSISMIIFFISFNVHMLSLLFLLGVAFYVVLMFSQKFLKSKRLEFDKYLATAVLSVIAFIFLLSFCSYFGQNMSFCIILGKTAFNYSTVYLVLIIHYLFGSFPLLTGAFFVLGIILSLSKGSRILLYYSSFILSSFLYLVFFSHRRPDPRYLSEIMPFMYMFASLAFIVVMESFSSKMDAKRRKPLWVVFAIFMIFNCSITSLEYKNLDLMGGYVKSMYSGDFEIVLEYLGETYEEGEIVLDIDPKDYYLRDYRDKNINIVHLDSYWDDMHRDVLDYHKRYKSGWLIFQRGKSWHFNEETLIYIQENFDYVEELNGTNIEVYRW